MDMPPKKKLKKRPKAGATHEETTAPRRPKAPQALGPDAGDHARTKPHTERCNTSRHANSVAPRTKVHANEIA